MVKATHDPSTDAALSYSETCLQRYQLREAFRLTALDRGARWLRDALRKYGIERFKQIPDDGLRSLLTAEGTDWRAIPDKRRKRRTKAERAEYTRLHDVLWELAQAHGYEWFNRYLRAHKVNGVSGLFKAPTDVLRALVEAADGAA